MQQNEPHYLLSQNELDYLKPFFDVGLNLSAGEGTSGSNSDRRLHKRRKWSTTSTSGPSMSMLVGKEGSLLKKIVTEVIAERDAQIAAALFEVAKNQPHLQMMVQTVRNLSVHHFFCEKFTHIWSGRKQCHRKIVPGNCASECTGSFFFFERYSRWV